MKTLIQKWGNRLALRIRRPLAKESSIPAPRFTLDQLVEQITPENCHAELGTGEHAGNEFGSRAAAALTFTRT